MEQLNRQTNGVKISELKAGETFRYAGIAWIKLNDRAEGGCLVLAADVLFCKAFDVDNKNNWVFSTLRGNLNSFDSNGESCAVKGVKKEDLIEFERDLTTDDGMTNYGTCRDFISLYTCDEYRKFRKYIPTCGRWHWTITADSLVYSDYVRLVNSDGTLNYFDARNGRNGVRPLCVLKSEILVERL